MTVAEAKIEIERLSELIHQYNYSYYVETSSQMSDFEFDTFLKNLQELEAEFPTLSSTNSPTKRVGADISKKFELQIFFIKIKIKISLFSVTHRK